MGLDMYLERKKKKTNNVIDTIINQKYEEVFYWRKAYAINDYFDNLVNGLENLKKYSISFEDIEDLKDRIEKILNDNSLASELLPDQIAIFTSTLSIKDNAYDYFYFEMLEDTLKGLKKIEEKDFEEYNYFYSAWW